MSFCAYELGTLIIRLTHEQRVAFPRLIYQGTKKDMATRSLMHNFPISCNLTTSQPLYPITTTAEMSLLFARPARQRGCMVVICP